MIAGYEESEEPLFTKQLAERAMLSADLDAADKVLAKSGATKIVQVLRQQHIRGEVQDTAARKVRGFGPLRNRPNMQVSR